MFYEEDTKGAVVERAIARNPGITFEELVERTDLNRREVSKVLLELEREGFLSFTGDPPNIKRFYVDSI
jgi:DNA-binding IclR family transcriptional regulator